eukprot:3308634-Rhodomonas_salina.1
MCIRDRVGTQVAVMSKGKVLHVRDGCDASLPTATELCNWRAVACSKLEHIRVGARVSQEFLVTYTVTLRKAPQ